VTRRKRTLDRVPRKLRAAVDLLLAAALLLVCWCVFGCPGLGEETRFRLAEKAALAGPSEILDRLAARGEWGGVRYDTLYLADDGDEILFYVSRKGALADGRLIRREKEDGLLLTTVPTEGPILRHAKDWMQVPLFLFADDEAAVRATLHIRLSDSYALTLTQVRGAAAQPALEPGALNGYARERFFWFNLPASPALWDAEDGARLRELLRTNQAYAYARTEEFPATIRLFDENGALLEEREYVVRGPWQ
jgi:hypothetical protein